MEDSEDNVALFTAFLKKSEHAVDIATNGLEAVEKFREFEYDIIFMDMQMPQMDGYTATREIRKIESGESNKKVPIVALTAYALKGDRDKSMEAGCDDYLTKPIKKSLVFETIFKYCSNN